MERNDFYVYEHQLEDGQVFYVGQGCRHRATSPYSRSIRWNDITSKQNYKVIIVKDNLTEKESLELEAELIKKYGRLDNSTGTLINHNDGGIGLKGEDNYFYGKSLDGDKNGNYGNKYELNSLSKPVLMLDTKGIIIQRFSSAREAEELYNYDSACISGCCLGKRLLHKGMQFIYESDYITTKDYTYKPGKTSKQRIVSAKLINNDEFELIKTYDSSQDVEKDGYNAKCVNACTNGTKKTHKGLYWFKVDSMPQEAKEFIYTNKI